MTTRPLASPFGTAAGSEFSSHLTSDKRTETSLTPYTLTPQTTPHTLDEKESKSAEGKSSKEPEDVSQVHVAYCCLKNEAGIAYFDDGVIFLGSSPRHGQDLEILEELRDQFPHVTIITNSSVNRENILEKLDNQHLSVVVGDIKAFQYQAAISMLSSIEIKGMAPPEKLDARREFHLRSALDVENVVAIQACGGLLAHLMKNQMLTDMGGTDIPSIRDLCTLPTNLISLDHWTLQSLSIFASDYHPYSSQARKKEGLSIFGLLNKTRTKRGEGLLKSWLKYPTKDRDIIESRLGHVRIFINPKHQELVQAIRKELRNIKDIQRLLNRFYTVRATVVDWQSFFLSLQGINQITSLAAQLEGIPALDNIRKAASPNLATLTTTIGRVVDFQESKALGSVIIQRGVNEKLDSLKVQLETLDDFLDMAAIEDMKANNFPDVLKEVRYIYFPQFGYHVQVPRNELTSPSINSGALGDLSYRFCTDESIYYKNFRTAQLDETFGDLSGLISDSEAAIVRQLTTQVLQYGDEVEVISNRVYELDCLLSLAEAAVLNDFVEPSLVEESVLRIEEGFHPLQSLCTETFIPNDTLMDSNLRRVQILTGPNASGKSIYLKQVGIIVFMAHIGSFVPATSAVVGYVDKIFTRIDTSSSAMMNLSTFARDASQASRMLHKCTESSLVLVDEFGKGTFAFDGCALLGCMITSMDNLGRRCPRAIFSTHFHELFVERIIAETDIVKFYRMSILENKHPEGKKKFEEDIVFLYKIEEGVCLHSYGINCARRLGLSAEVLSRAEVILQHLSEGSAVQPVDNSSQAMKARQIRMFDLFSKSQTDIAAVKELKETILENP